MEIIPTLKLDLPRYFTNAEVTIRLQNRLLTDIKVQFHHTIKTTTYIGIGIDFEHDPVGYWSEKTVSINNKYIEKELLIYIDNHGAYQFKVNSSSFSIKYPDILSIFIDVSIEKTSYGESIKPVDPILMYYRKILPYSKYTIYGSFRGEIVNLGKIKTVTYDTTTKKFKIYSREGLSIEYDTLPLVNPTKVNVEGTQYTNPPSTIWLIDEGDIDDLYWVKQIEIHEIDFDENDMYYTLSDFIYDFIKDNVLIDKIVLEMRSTNTRLTIDFQRFPHLDPKEYLQNISTDIVTVFHVPFRQLYSKLDPMKYRYTELTIYYSNTDRSSSSKFTLKGFFITDTKNTSQ